MPSVVRRLHPFPTLLPVIGRGEMPGILKGFPARRIVLHDGINITNIILFWFLISRVPQPFMVDLQGADHLPAVPVQEVQNPGGKETYKAPYEVHPKDHKRQCVFAGTSNTLDFLPLDRTGNRRFLPVQVQAEAAEVHILEDEAASRAYIGQMWAEVMEVYRKGDVKLKLSPAMERYLKEHQRSFMPDRLRFSPFQPFLWQPKLDGFPFGQRLETRFSMPSVVRRLRPFPALLPVPHPDGNAPGIFMEGNAYGKTSRLSGAEPEEK